MTRKVVGNSDPGTATKHGGDSTDQINLYLTGQDQSATDPVPINTTTTFGLGKLVAPYYIPASYMVYQDSSGRVYALNGTTGAIQYQTASSPATSADTTTLFNNVFTQLQTVGGLVFVRRGTFGPYVVNGLLTAGVSGTPLPITRLLGEEREGTVLQMDATASLSNLIKCYCGFGCQNITLDANTKGQHLIDQQQGYDLYVDNVHFKPGPEIGLFTGNLLRRAIVKNSYFDVTPGTYDQYAASMDTTNCQYLIIENNYFDKRTGTLDGSSLTSAAYKNTVIKNNVIDRAVGHLTWGISLENWNNNYSNIVIAENIINNGTIAIGGNTNPSIIWDNLLVSKNVMTGGAISLFSGNSTILRAISIDGNTINNPYGAGIYTEATGHHIIANNIIRESNQELNATTAARGCICVFDNASNAEIFGNTIVMTDTRTNASPYGIRFGSSNTNINVYRNKFINTTSNPTRAGPFGTPSNIKMKDNNGYVTNVDGVTLFSGNNATTAFTITHGLAVTPNNPPLITTNQNIHAYVSAVTSTTFTVTFASAPATGSNNVAIGWHAENTVLA